VGVDEKLAESRKLTGFWFFLRANSSDKLEREVINAYLQKSHMVSSGVAPLGRGGA
jgi:hypothetical protein